MRPWFFLILASVFWVGVTGCSDDAAPARQVEEVDTGSDAGVDVTPDVEEDVAEDVGLADVAPPLQPTTVETDLILSIVKAGDVVGVNCRVLDQFGEDMDAQGMTWKVTLSPSGSFEVSGEQITATRVGQALVQCGLVEAGLVDLTPAELEILPGAAHTVVTAVDAYQVRAGESVTATCQVFDAYGNVVDVDPEVQVSPNDRVTVSGKTVGFEVADVYEVGCHVEGALYEPTQTVEVVPSDPAAIAVALVPNQDVYAIGQVVELAYVVTDAYGNVITDADVVVSSSPAGQEFGDGRFRYSEEGSYVLSADVQGPTANGVVLHEDVTIVVNSNGPGIECLTPGDGGMLDIAPGAQINFTGRVADANGVSGVTVNGLSAVVNPDGTFASPVNVTWGINFVELVALDAFGVENTRYCAFLVSDDWKPEGPSSYLDNGVLMLLNQPAVDDANRSDLDSLADILHRVLNSSGLRDQLHTSLLAANPLKPSACDSQTCTFLGCVCWLRSEMIYLDSRIVGPHPVTMSLVNGGLRIQTRINNVSIKVRVRGHVSGIPYDTEGWVTVRELDVDLVLNISSSAGRPRATVRSVTTTVGPITTDFNGLDGGIIDIVVDLFNGTVRNLIRDAIQGFVQNNFNGILDNLFGSLDISSLGTSFSVPRLDGAGQVTLSFDANLTGLDVNTTRARFGIGTRIRPSVVAVANPSLGTALPPAALNLEPSGTQPVVVGIYVAILNQALHSLWRGGFLNADLGAAFAGGGGLPAGLSARIEGLLPPVIENISGNKVRLMLGGLRLNLVYPGVFDVGLPVTLGATATTTVTVQNNALQFGVLTLESLYFSTEGVSLDAHTRTILESFLTGLVQGIINASLNNALPALPIPSFTLPASLATFGLPANGQLSIVTTSTAQTTSQYILRGNFAIQ